MRILIMQSLFSLWLCNLVQEALKFDNLIMHSSMCEILWNIAKIIARIFSLNWFIAPPSCWTADLWPSLMSHFSYQIIELFRKTILLINFYTKNFSINNLNYKKLEMIKIIMTKIDFSILSSEFSRAESNISLRLNSIPSRTQWNQCISNELGEFCVRKTKFGIKWHHKCENIFPVYWKKKWNSRLWWECEERNCLEN